MDWGTKGLAVAVVVLLSGVMGLGSPALAADAGPRYYLALGGSDSVGFQPTVDVPHGAPTEEG